MNAHVFVAIALCAVSAEAQQASAIAADPLQRGTWVADEERDEVALVSVDGGVAAFAVGGWPEKVVAESTGRVFISSRADGRIDIISPSFEFSALQIGAEPKAMVLDEKDRRLYVGLVTERALAVVDLDSLAIIKKVALPAEPHALAKFGKSIAVLPRKGDSVFFVDDCLCKDKPRRIRLPTGAEKRLADEHGPIPVAWFGQALAVTPKGLLVFHSSVDTGLSEPLDPELGVGESEAYGGDFRPVRAIVTLISGGEALVVDKGHDYFALPMAEITDAVVRDGLVYALSRSQSVLHVSKLKELIKDPGEAFRSHWSPHPAGDGPVGLAVDKTGVQTFSSFDRKLLTFVRHPQARTILWPPETSDDDERPAPWGRVFAPGRWGKGTSSGPRVLKDLLAVKLGVGTFDAQLALGRKLFFTVNDPRISSAALTCSTCHLDGRQDGLVWLQHGGHRQTPVLAGRMADSAPYGWRGEHETLEKSLEATVKRLSGRGLPLADREALARYLREGLRPIHRPKVEASPLVERGREIFHDSVVGCAECHPSDAAFSDGATHDVATLSARERNDLKAANTKREPAFDTPDLRSLAFSAPYFHDGSRDSLEALIQKNKDTMGKTSHLSPEDVSALVAFLETL